MLENIGKWGGSPTPDIQDSNLTSIKEDSQTWRTAKKSNYKMKFSSVAPSGVEDFQLKKDSNWDPNSVAEDWRFPWIYDPMVYQDYLDHQRDCLNVKSVIAMLLSIFIPIVFTRSNFPNLPTYDWWWWMSFSCLAVTMAVCNLHFACMAIRYLTRHKMFNLSSRWLDMAKNLGFLPDAAVVAAAITHSFELIGRVRNGQCPEGTDIWQSQGCNPVADSHSVPHDSVIVLLLVPVLIMTYLKGCTIQWAAFAYAICITGIAVAVWMVGGYLQIYSVLYGGIFVMILFEMERTKRVSFLLSRWRQLTKDTLHAEKFAAVTSRNQAEMAEAQMRHLRALMSNVAHDLKAPVACIVADTTLLREASENAGLNINGVFLSCSNSIYASATFMMMAINRSQDFVKSSLNLALVPNISPFSIMEALSFACDCVETTIQPLGAGGMITLHPMPTSICSYVSSDGQWLVDNLMCMISNAIKYGPAGTRVDVHVKLVPHNQSVSSMMFSTRTNSWLGWGECQTTQSTTAVRRIPGGGIVVGDNNSDEDLLFLVEDNGIGLPEDRKSTVFSPHQQPDRTIGGVGVGLYALRKRVEALNGECGVINRFDKKDGVVFWFRFRYIPQWELQAEMGSFSKNETKESKDFPKFRRVPPSQKTVKFGSTHSFQDYPEREQDWNDPRSGNDSNHYHHTSLGDDAVAKGQMRSEIDVSIPSTTTNNTLMLSKSDVLPTETLKQMKNEAWNNTILSCPNDGDGSIRMEEGLMKGRISNACTITPTPTSTSTSLENQKYRILVVNSDSMKVPTKGVSVRGMDESRMSSSYALLTNTKSEGRKYVITTAINGYDALGKLKESVYGSGVYDDDDGDGYDAVVIDLYDGDYNNNNNNNLTFIQSFRDFVKSYTRVAEEEGLFAPKYVPMVACCYHSDGGSHVIGSATTVADGVHNNTDAVSKMALAAGVNDIIHSPCTSAKLIACLESLAKEDHQRYFVVR